MLFDGHDPEAVDRARAAGTRSKAAGHEATYWQQNGRAAAGRRRHEQSEPARAKRQRDRQAVLPTGRTGFCSAGGRYLGLVALIAVIGISRSAFSAVRGQRRDASIYKKSGIGLPLLYMIALILVGIFQRIATPVGPGADYCLYTSHWLTAMRGFLLMFVLGSLTVFGFYLLIRLTGPT